MKSLQRKKIDKYEKHKKNEIKKEMRILNAENLR